MHSKAPIAEELSNRYDTKTCTDLTSSLFRSKPHPLKTPELRPLTPSTSRSSNQALPSRILSKDITHPDVPSFSVPDKAVLQRVMMAQGDVRRLAKPILPSITFTDLLKKRVPFDVMNKVNRPIVTLTVNCSSKGMLGPAGSFKTCHPALLEQSESKQAGDTILGVEAIVAKHCFYRKAVEGAKKSAITSSPSGGRKRLAVKDELVKMLDEANCLYWATSLMALIYSFVNNKLTQRPLVSPSPVIPRLCVVHAALAIPQDTRESRSAVYLLEEKISGRFVKYINNNCATPRDHLAPPELEITMFSCFAQHTQYHFSQGLVFVSDFQGSGGILKDCQIITTNDFANNFGDGNWTVTLDNFSSLHKCNEYCLYFGLPSLAVAGSATIKRALEEADIMSSQACD